MISIYFRCVDQGWETLNLRFDPMIFRGDIRRKLIEIGCNYHLFGNSAINQGIDKFISDPSVIEYAFSVASDHGDYRYVIRREKDK